MNNVKVGQTWQDWDVRFRNDTPRFIKIIEFVNDLYVQVENTNSKRKTIIRVSRFKPNSNGYKLVKNI